MREILFRGKRKDNGEWVEGIPIKTYDTEIGINLPLRYKPKNITLMNNDRVLLCCAMDDSAYFDAEDYPIIDDETICQYTGLKDKNGLTKIFEYDIIDANGRKVGNYYENSNLLKDGTCLLVARMGTKEWPRSEQEAIKRGCKYAE